MPSRAPAALPAPALPTAPATAAASPIVPTAASPAATTPWRGPDAIDTLFGEAGTDEASAWRALAAAWGVALPAGDPCAVAVTQSLHCYRTRGGLGPIRQLDRPGIVALSDANGRIAHWLLTGLGSDSATLRAGNVERTLPLATLARAWRGEFATLWRAPSGYRAGEIVTTDGALAPWLGERLAKIDGSDALPASPDALMARVFAFQLAQGLAPDGLAGPLTLMQLNRASGVAEPRLQR